MLKKIHTHAQNDKDLNPKRGTKSYRLQSSHRLLELRPQCLQRVNNMELAVVTIVICIWLKTCISAASSGFTACRRVWRCHLEVDWFDNDVLTAEISVLWYPPEQLSY